ncbi:DMT family transporter [Marinobacteraceae bacterium S3BR75-40.1]
MSGRTLGSAIALLVFGNALAIGSDVVIKLAGADIPLFQFVFLRCVFTVLCLLPFLGQVSRDGFWQGLRIHLVRAHVHLTGIICMVVALTYLPLATANAIFYAAPLLVVVIAFLFAGEKPRLPSILAVISGFIGVLVILRPGGDVGWAGLAALAMALCLAIGAVLVRKLPRDQTTVHKLLLNSLLVLPASFALMMWEGAPWSSELLLYAIGSAVLILGYNMTVLLAYRHVEANQVTSAEYTGLVWAILIGWLGFGEVPDPVFLVGAGLIVVPLVLLSLKGRFRGRRPIGRTSSAMGGTAAGRYRQEAERAG